MLGYTLDTLLSDNDKMNIQDKIQEFKTLPYEERLSIAMNIITNLKDKGNTQAKDIYDYVSTLEVVPDNILESIYLDFEESIEKIKNEKVESELHKFDKVQAYIHTIREREEKEKEGENSESLLEQI